MELFLIFLLIAFSILLIFISKAYDSRVILFGPMFVFIFLGINILQFGYEIPGGVSSTAQANYTFNASTSSNLLTTLSISNVQLYENRLNWTSQLLGLFLLGTGFALGIIATGFV